MKISTDFSQKRKTSFKSVEIEMFTKDFPKGVDNVMVKFSGPDLKKAAEILNVEPLSKVIRNFSVLMRITSQVMEGSSEKVKTFELVDSFMAKAKKEEDLTKKSKKALQKQMMIQFQQLGELMQKATAQKSYTVREPEVALETVKSFFKGIK